MTDLKKKWEKLLCSTRLVANQSKQRDTRNEFHKDYDRIIFCSAFRRLGKKTQVHPLSKNDHIHTRLTHSMEVSSVGRTLGQEAGEFLLTENHLPDRIQPQDIAAIVQAACLAHDIGNPPFGHAGEYAIRHWFRENVHKLQLNCDHEINDLQCFEGNAQGFRLVTQIENSRSEGGLKLTCATLGTLVKYPWPSNHTMARSQGKWREKFNFFKSEAEISHQVFSLLGLHDPSTDTLQRHPLSYLMEAADDICYKILDIEDGFELGLLRYHEIKKILVKLAGEEYDKTRLKKDWSERRKIYFLRSRAIKNLIKKVIQIFKENYTSIMQADFRGDLISRVDGEEQKGIKKAKKIANENLFLHERKIQLELGAYETISTILEALIDSVNEHIRGTDISFKSQRIMDLIGKRYFDMNASHYHNYLLVTDQVSGMTDDYATYIANQLRGLAI